jgi:hypothetical protein
VLTTKRVERLADIVAFHFIDFRVCPARTTVVTTPVARCVWSQSWVCGVRCNVSALVVISRPWPTNKRNNEDKVEWEWVAAVAGWPCSWYTISRRHHGAANANTNTHSLVTHTHTLSHYFYNSSYSYYYCYTTPTPVCPIICPACCIIGQFF